MSNTIKRRGESRRSTNRVRPGLESLEHRLVLSTFRVNSTLDTVAVNFKSGKDASGHISLRSAIMAADAKGGNNKIVLPAGTFTLTIAPTGADDVTTGDLNITGNLTIKGKNPASTIIDGNNLDRVFQISSGKVSISNLTIQHGRVVGDGGGILNSGGNVTLTSVRLLNDVAVGSLRHQRCDRCELADRNRRQRRKWDERDQRRRGWDLQCGRFVEHHRQHDRVQRGGGWFGWCRRCRWTG